LIFATNTIIPQAILPTLPTVAFEIVPEEPKPVLVANSSGKKPTPAPESLG
jgi:hypothetical protein